MMTEQREDMKVEMTKSMSATIELTLPTARSSSTTNSPEIHRGGWRQDGAA